jgi:hypothetical protein
MYHLLLMLIKSNICRISLKKEANHFFSCSYLYCVCVCVDFPSSSWPTHFRKEIKPIYILVFCIISVINLSFSFLQINYLIYR